MNTLKNIDEIFFYNKLIMELEINEIIVNDLKNMNL